MNLNTHILFNTALGVAIFHNVEIAALIGIGAALPDLDREYILTNKLSLAQHQLHRALFHNIFFALLIFMVNMYLGIGIFLHIMLDMLTSPADRGVEVLFPLGRLIKDFHLDYDGLFKEKRGLLWHIEDPLRVIRITSADKDLTPSGSKSPWIRIYGPFKNSRVADWIIFYSSIIFLILFDIDHLPIITYQIFYSVIKYFPLILGIVLFYLGGEIWRRKFQRRGSYRNLIAITMLTGVIFILYGIAITIIPPSSPESLFKLSIITIISVITGFIIAYIHVRIRHKLIII
jgi:hypothetical protein